MTALVVGAVLTVAALAFVLYPLFAPPRRARTTGLPAASGRDASEITEDAVESFIRAYRARQAVCPVCGPRPEPDARHCSTCGRALASVCPRCGARAADPGARSCGSCGAALSS